MLKIKVKGKKLEYNIVKFMRQKFPAGLATALTKTAFDTRDGLNANTRGAFDRPTPFTQKAFMVRGARPATLTALVHPKQKQAVYLAWQILGGTDYRPKAVPGRNATLNKYGNLPRYATRTKTTMVGDIKGLYAWFRLVGGGANRNLELLAFIPNSRNYRRQFPVKILAEMHAKRTISNQIKRQYVKALAGLK
jgi:hypothetical protein